MSVATDMTPIFLPRPTSKTPKAPKRKEQDSSGTSPASKTKTPKAAKADQTDKSDKTSKTPGKTDTKASKASKTEEPKPVKQKAVKAKREAPPALAASGVDGESAKVVKRRKKLTEGVLLTPERNRQLDAITNKARMTPQLTLSVINHALACVAATQDLLNGAPKQRELLEAEKASALTAPGLTAQQLSKTAQNYDRKLAQLDRILQTANAHPKPWLRAQDELFLRKLPRPQPARPPSPYLKFCNAMRPRFAQAHEAKFGEKPPFGRVGQMLGECWRKLTPEQRQAWAADDVPHDTIAQLAVEA